MPKLRQIPRLFPRRHADGRTVWHWKPSASLRAGGFKNIELGTDHGAAVNRAMELNRQVESWRRGGGPAGSQAATPIQRLVRFGELVARFRKSQDFPTNKATVAEYEVRFRQLAIWANDLPVVSIDKFMTRELREGLMKGSPWVAASVLRILRLLLNWARSEGIVTVNVMDGIKVPTPPSRKVRLDDAPREAIIASAKALHMPDIELATELAFWCIQRQADMLLFNRAKWREMEGLERAGPDRAMLVDKRGRVMSFRFQQNKTGVWIDAPIPPHLHDQIAWRMSKSPTGWLFQDDLDPNLPMPDWKFQRRFRAAREHARDRARAAGDEALAVMLDTVQFRDLRRTGMIFYRNMGARVPWVTALSGHAVMLKKTILDTYMPGDPESAVRCVETGLSGLSARAERARTEEADA